MFSFKTNIRQQTLKLATVSILVGLLMPLQSKAQWELNWSDEFNGTEINTDIWNVLTRAQSFNDEKQYYLPEQATIENGNLVITATNEPFGGQQYRSARLESKLTQLYGRVEVRAKIPTTKGIWPAIWMFPVNTPWPTGGEIDIMEHGGSKPFVVSSAYHYNDEPGTSEFVFSEYNTGVNWSQDFHTYSVEWEPSQVRYYVNGVNHFTMNNNEPFPVSSTPMNVILNTAVGGFFDGDPDGSTVFPQRFEIDYVRTYNLTSNVAPNQVANGDFETGIAPWGISGNSFREAHDLGRFPSATAIEGNGGHAMKMYGFGNTFIQQTGIAAEAGQSLKLEAFARTNADDSIRGTGNRVEMTVEWFNALNQSLGAQTQVILDGGSAENSWLESTMNLLAPADTETLNITIRFVQPFNEGGAAWIDGVNLIPEPGSAAILGLSSLLLARRRVAQ